MMELKQKMKQYPYIHGVAYWISGTKIYNSVVKRMKDMPYVVVVDSHVGHYMFALAAVKIYKENYGIDKIGVIIDKKYSNMVSLWKDDIADTIVLDDTNAMYRFNNYLYIRKQISSSYDKRIIPYYYGKGDFMLVSDFLLKNYRNITKNPDVDFHDIANRNLPKSDIAANLILTTKFGSRFSKPNLELSLEDISLFQKLGIEKGKGLLLVPAAQSSKSFGISLQRKIASYAEDKGIKVYLNGALGEKSNIDNVSVLGLDVATTLKAAHYMGHAVGAQSGIIDILVLSGFRDMRVVTFLETGKYDVSAYKTEMLKETGIDSKIYVDIDVSKNLSEEEIVRRIFDNWI
jgi:hypothetical protein